jgi:hypothetical protein
LCEHCNYVKEVDQWRSTAGVDRAGRHGTTIETPTGEHHHTVAPPLLPGRRKVHASRVEQRIALTVYDLHAA